MELINDAVLNFKLVEGYSAETSGGLFIICPPESVQPLQEELLNTFGQTSWEIGEVVASENGEKKAIFGKDDDFKNIEIIHVTESFLADEKTE